MKIILASTSPRRTQILKLANIEHIVIGSNIEETINPCFLPYEVVESLAEQKTMDVAQKYPNDIVVGADTIVVVNNKILGKPKDQEDAINMLQDLSDCTHQVITGVCIYSPCSKIVYHEVTDVTFKKMTYDEIIEYIDREYIYDKAGAYAIQGMACRYISKINGDYYNVMGLPVMSIYEKLNEIKKQI